MLLMGRSPIAGRCQIRRALRHDIWRRSRNVRLRFRIQVKGALVVFGRRRSQVVRKLALRRHGLPMRMTVVVGFVRIVRKVNVAVLAVRDQFLGAHAGMDVRRHGGLQLPRTDQQKCQDSTDHITSIGCGESAQQPGPRRRS